MKKTKIICSIGPASGNVEVMEQLVLKGMNCARINLSHASEDSILETIEVVRAVRKKTGMPVAIMYDTKGPEFRTLEIENDKISIKTDQIIKIVKNVIKYVRNTLNPLECLSKNFFFEDFNAFSIPLQGIYKIYARSNAIKNGAIT